MSTINKIKIEDVEYDIEDSQAREELENKANKTEIPTVPTKTSELINDSGFLTEIPEEYAKKKDIPSIEGLATEEYVDNALANIEIPEGGIEEEWKLARDITVEQDISRFDITTDDDGNKLNFREGYIEFYNPGAGANIVCYVTIYGEKSNVPQCPFGYIANSGNPVRYRLMLNRVNDRLYMEASYNNSNSVNGSKVFYQDLMNIGNIKGFIMRTDGDSRLFIKAGATLKLYTKGVIE